MAHTLAPLAERDLDDIWYDLAEKSGSIEIANRMVDSITDRFLLLARFPHLGRSRSDDFGSGSRSFVVGDHVIVYTVEGDDVLILRVAHGRRDFDKLFPRSWTATASCGLPRAILGAIASEVVPAINQAFELAIDWMRDFAMAYYRGLRFDYPCWHQSSPIGCQATRVRSGRSDRHSRDPRRNRV